MTFDENIRYRQIELTLDSEAWGKPILRPDQVLMELKTSAAVDGADPFKAKDFQNLVFQVWDRIPGYFNDKSKRST